MAIHIIWRLLVLALGLLVGWELGAFLANWMPITTPIGIRYYPYIVSLVFALIGFFVAPYVTVVPYRKLRKKLSRANVHSLLMGVIGAFVGLLISALMALPLSMLPGRWGQISPLVVTVAFAIFFAMTMIMRERDLFNLIGVVVGREGMRRKRNVVLLDTSVIIDGRIADICQSGFVRETMLVPRFVLDELQHIADSADVLRRNRGRRGLDVLNRMQKDDSMPLEISEMDTDEVREVDAKLVKLAQRLQCPVVTNDFNLNRVAELQGVPVMNINELANAVKAVVLPGESLEIQIIQEGKEHGQGVGYLDDGTMVVVEDGRRHIGDSVVIAVTRVLQTVAGRMIFGQIQTNGAR